MEFRVEQAEEIVGLQEGLIQFSYQGGSENVGEWEIVKDGPFRMVVVLTKKPNWFRRVFAKLFFGIKWINYK